MKWYDLATNTSVLRLQLLIYDAKHCIAAHKVAIPFAYEVQTMNWWDAKESFVAHPLM